MNPEEYNERELNGMLGGCDDRKNGCSTVNYQFADISVPINVKPETTIGDITIECCDDPVVECCENECKNGLDIIVNQKVCIKIPIKYQIDTCVGEDSISCC